jgi:hypothetical protein
MSLEFKPKRREEGTVISERQTKLVLAGKEIKVAIQVQKIESNKGK